jgi:hypothetical protein
MTNATRDVAEMSCTSNTISLYTLMSLTRVYSAARTSLRKDVPYLSSTKCSIVGWSRAPKLLLVKRPMSLIVWSLLSPNALHSSIVLMGLCNESTQSVSRRGVGRVFGESPAGVVIWYARAGGGATC